MRQRNAQGQGALAAANVLGGAEACAAVPWFWSDRYNETLQVVGLVDEAVESVERDLGEARLAEMMVARRAYPDKATLASPGVKLKTLLAV